MLDDARSEPTGRILPDVFAENQLHVVWSPQVEIVTDHVLKELLPCIGLAKTCVKLISNCQIDSFG